MSITANVLIWCCRNFQVFYFSVHFLKVCDYNKYVRADTSKGLIVVYLPAYKVTYKGWDFRDDCLFSNNLGFFQLITCLILCQIIKKENNYIQGSGLNLGIIIFKQFQVVFNSLMFVGNPVCIKSASYTPLVSALVEKVLLVLPRQR